MRGIRWQRGRVGKEHKSTVSQNKYTAMQADAWGGVFSVHERHPGIRER